MVRTEAPSSSGLLLSAYGFVLRLRHKVDQRLVAMAFMVLAGIQIFFLILVILSLIHLA